MVTMSPVLPESDTAHRHPSFQPTPMRYKIRPPPGPWKASIMSFIEVSKLNQHLENYSQKLLDSIRLLATATLYGAHLVFVICTTLLCKRSSLGSQRSTGKVALIVATNIMMLVSTAMLAIQTAVTIGDVKAVVWYTVEVNNSPRSILSTLETSLIYLNIVIGDSIVFWRVCALWRDRQTVVYLPGALLVCTAVSWLSFTGCSIQSDWDSHNPKCNPVILLTYVLSLSANIPATGAIWYKTWLHRKAVREYLGAGNHKARIEKVLVLVMESGIIYSVMMVLGILTFINFQTERSFKEHLITNLVDDIGKELIASLDICSADSD